MASQSSDIDGGVCPPSFCDYDDIHDWSSISGVRNGEGYPCGGGIRMTSFSISGIGDFS